MIGTSAPDQSTSPGSHERQRELDAGVARALLEHARIADDEQARGVRQAPVGEHARALLGADAGGSRRASGRAAGTGRSMSISSDR